MFEKFEKGKKFHDMTWQPRTCNHPIYAGKLTGICQNPYNVVVYDTVTGQQYLKVNMFP